MTTLELIHEVLDRDWDPSAELQVMREARGIQCRLWRSWIAYRNGVMLNNAEVLFGNSWLVLPVEHRLRCTYKWTS